MCLLTCMRTAWVLSSQRPEEGIRSSGTDITDSYEMPCGCWEPNPGPLQEQQVLLSPEQSLQPPFFNLKPTCSPSFLEHTWRKAIWFDNTSPKPHMCIYTYTDVHKSINIIQHINDLTDRSHMNILRDPKSPLAKFKMLKSTGEPRNREIPLLNKSYAWQTCNSMLVLKLWNCWNIK